MTMWPMLFLWLSGFAAMLTLAHCRDDDTSSAIICALASVALLTAGVVL